MHFYEVIVCRSTVPIYLNLLSTNITGAKYGQPSAANMLEGAFKQRGFAAPSSAERWLLLRVQARWLRLAPFIGQARRKTHQEWKCRFLLYCYTSESERLCTWTPKTQTPRGIQDIHIESRLVNSLGLLFVTKCARRVVHSRLKRRALQ